MTKIWTVGLVLFCAFLASLGQLLFKLGSGSVSTSFLSWITNIKLISGMFIYAFSAVLFIIALKHGNLSLLYPVMATSFIWVSILSVKFLGEPFSPTKWLSIALIIIAVSLIVRGS